MTSMDVEHITGAAPIAGAPMRTDEHTAHTRPRYPFTYSNV